MNGVPELPVLEPASEDTPARLRPTTTANLPPSMSLKGSENSTPHLLYLMPFGTDADERA